MPKASGMTVGAIYELAVALGRKADPRGDERVAEILNAEQSAYDELSDEKKQYFDEEALSNPYPDTRILNGDVATPVKTVCVRPASCRSIARASARSRGLFSTVRSM